MILSARLKKPQVIFYNNNMNNSAELLLKSATEFYHLVSEGQTVNADYALVDNIRKVYGPRITADVSAILNSKAVSSIPIRVSYARPKVTFLVDARGQDSEEVNKLVTDLLNKKYAAGIAAMLAKASESNFEFGLLTVE